MPEMKLDVVDAAELAELLQFLSQWLARDPARLGDSLALIGSWRFPRPGWQKHGVAARTYVRGDASGALSCSILRRVFRVLGWSSPRTRSWSGSSSRNSRSASSLHPDSAVK